MTYVGETGLDATGLFHRMKKYKRKISENVCGQASVVGVVRGIQTNPGITKYFGLSNAINNIFKEKEKRNREGHTFPLSQLTARRITRFQKF
ncbi:unnamed protein product [Colias eurytheme]|nr:unnamed protein product [Colias eurytheme]